MITYYSNDAHEIKSVGGSNQTKYLVEIACLHDDVKPTEKIVTGSLALEVDTGDIYAFDEAGSQWNKING